MYFFHLVNLSKCYGIITVRSIKKTLISYESTFISYNNCMYTNGTTQIDMHEHTFISQL